MRHLTQGERDLLVEEVQSQLKDGDEKYLSEKTKTYKGPDNKTPDNAYTVQEALNYIASTCEIYRERS